MGNDTVDAPHHAAISPARVRPPIAEAEPAPLSSAPPAARMRPRMPAVPTAFAFLLATAVAYLLHGGTAASALEAAARPEAAADLGALRWWRLAGALGVGFFSAAVVRVVARCGGSSPPFRAAAAVAFVAAGHGAAAAAAGDLRSAPVAALAAALLLFATTRPAPSTVVAWAAAAIAAVVAAVRCGAELPARLLDAGRTLAGRRPEDDLAAWGSVAAACALLWVAARPAPRAFARGLGPPLLVGALALAAATGEPFGAAFAMPGTGAFALAALAAAAYGVAALRATDIGRGAALIASFAVFVGAHAATDAKRDADERPTRTEAARLAGLAARELPPREARGDVLLGVPEEGPRRFRSALRAAGRSDLLFDLADLPGAAPRRIRIARYGVPLAAGFGAGLPPEAQLVVDALVDDALRLDEPQPGARLTGLTPDDEPEFVFSLPAAADPGADAHLFTAVLFVQEADGRVRARGVPLDASLVERTDLGDRVRYLWRPSWRSGSHADTELRIERGDLGAPGTRTWWTVLIGAPHSGLCAVGRPASAPADPRRARLFKRPVTAALPAPFDVPRVP
jgi:hypothetical protein